MEAADHSIRPKSIASSLLGLPEVRRTDWAGSFSPELLVDQTPKPVAAPEEAAFAALVVDDSRLQIAQISVPNRLR